MQHSLSRTHYCKSSVVSSRIDFHGDSCFILNCHLNVLTSILLPINSIQVGIKVREPKLRGKIVNTKLGGGGLIRESNIEEMLLKSNWEEDP